MLPAPWSQAGHCQFVCAYGNSSGMYLARSVFAKGEVILVGITPLESLTPTPKDSYKGAMKETDSPWLCSLEK